MARSTKKAADQILLTAMACGANVIQAAARAGVSERTVHRRLADPAFRARLQQTTDEMRQRTTRILIGASMAAAKTLHDLQHDPSVPAAVRCRAAGEILKLSSKYYHDEELETRLATLETQFADIISASHPHPLAPQPSRRTMPPERTDP